MVSILIYCIFLIVFVASFLAFNYGMEEEGRETPESDSFLKNLLEQMKSEPRTETIIHMDESRSFKKMDDDSEVIIFSCYKTLKSIKIYLIFF